jgi:acyl-coenzyme A thioesterase PaaI-like protein
VQPHGECTVIALLHEGPEPAVRGARVFVDAAARAVHGVWPVGRRVCGHPGIVHGGVSALILDEMFGQAYWAFYAQERGPGFTASLTVDYKAPAPASSWLLCSVTVVSEEGRKVRLAATLADGAPGGTVFATASCLFIVARKD